MDNNIENTDGSFTQGPVTTPLHTEAPIEPVYVRLAHTNSNPVIVTPAQPKKRNGFAGLLLVGMLILGMFVGGAGAGTVLLVAQGNTPATVAAAPASTTGSAASTKNSTDLVAAISQNTINSIYEKTTASIVRITSTVQSGNGRFAQTGEAVGTGMIVNTNGEILTNNHVIDGATKISVELSDGKTYAATVVGTAPQDDLALIKLTSAPSGLVAVTLGDSTTVQVGDEVIAIGYPYGLDQSVTSGIVSGLNRDGSASSSTSTTAGRTLSGMIQVDAAINPGNSGGPLLNAAGEVIGINTMIESPVEGFTGVGLSIPINQAKSLLTQLEGGSTVSRPWLGISGAEIDASIQQEYNLTVSSGILVVDVTAGGPAALAGIQGSTIADNSQFQGNGTTTTNQIGDIIVAIDGKSVASISDLTTYLNTKQVGDQVTLTIVRSGAQQSVKVTLQAWAASGASDTTTN